ncbi:PREDICTED: pre-mRNA-splicing regulator WTAP-like, partial [Fulmarus glacialis]|uniref:pre-mRNA-splicing regulator WTAP-like n=1 Tax=Fulmarus glacialis TaxID=30455 RepID=UPI00051ACF32
MTNEEPLPKKVRLSEADFKVLPRDELILRWKQYEAYVQALEGKYTDLNSNDVTGLRESEEKLKQQQQESARRENILVMRLATKEQEMQECTLIFQQQLCLEGLLLQNQANPCMSCAYFLLASINYAYLPKTLLLTVIGCRNKLKRKDKIEFTEFHLGGFRLIFTLDLDNK